MNQRVRPPRPTGHASLDLLAPVAPEEAAPTKAARTEKAPTPSKKAPAKPETKPATAVKAAAAPRKAPAGQPIAPVTEPVADRRPRVAGRSGRSLVTHQISLRYPHELYERLAAFSAAENRSQRMILLDAIEASYPQLVDAFTTTPNNGQQLFHRGPTRTTATVAVAERVSRSVAFTEDERDTINGLVATLGAPSAHELVMTALDLYLPPLASK